MNVQFHGHVSVSNSLLIIFNNDCFEYPETRAKEKRKQGGS